MQCFFYLWKPAAMQALVCSGAFYNISLVALILANTIAEQNPY